MLHHLDALSSFVSKEVLAALLGALVALVLPMLQATSKVKAGSATSIKSNKRAQLPSCWLAALITSSFGGLCVHAAKEAVTKGPFSVQLRRQQIPLHSADGVVHHKSAYYGQISVGAPVAQEFEVVFDTGSGHLVLPSIMCRTNSCRNHRRYRRRASMLAQDIDVDGTPVDPTQARDQITVSFGTGEVTGIFVQDQVCLGPPQTAPATPSVMIGSGASSSLLQVNRAKAALVSPPSEDEQELSVSEQDSRRHGCVDLRLISATEMTEDPFSSFQFDGVLGLGLPSLSQTPEFNFVEAAAPAGAWTSFVPGSERMFAVFLAKSNEEQSEITFGGWRDEHIKDGSQLSFCEARDPQDGYWQVDVFGIKANGKQLDFCTHGCRAIVDTGTSLLGVPSLLGPQLVDLLRHRASGPGGTCTGAGPRLEIDLGNFTVFLDPADYARPEFVDRVGSSEGSEANERILGENEFSDSCVPMVMHIDLPEPLHPRTLILGEPVLQRFYTLFDASSHRVGFAEARHIHSVDIPAHG
jgi:hypothetical protein